MLHLVVLVADARGRKLRNLEASQATQLKASRLKLWVALVDEDQIWSPGTDAPGKVLARIVKTNLIGQTLTSAE